MEIYTNINLNFAFVWVGHFKEKGGGKDNSEGLPRGRMRDEVNKVGL